MIRRWMRRGLRTGVLVGVVFGLFKWLTGRKAPEPRTNYAVHGISTAARPAPVAAPDAVAPPVIEPVPDIVVPQVAPAEVVVETAPDLTPVPDVTGPPTGQLPLATPSKGQRKPKGAGATSGGNGVDVEDPGGGA